MASGQDEDSDVVMSDAEEVEEDVAGTGDEEDDDDDDESGDEDDDSDEGESGQDEADDAGEADDADADEEDFVDNADDTAALEDGDPETKEDAADEEAGGADAEAEQMDVDGDEDEEEVELQNVVKVQTPRRKPAQRSRSSKPRREKKLAADDAAADAASLASTLSCSSRDSLSPPPEDPPPVSLHSALEQFRSTRDIGGMIAWQNSRIEEQTKSYKEMYNYLRKNVRKRQQRQAHSERLLKEAVRRSRTVVAQSSENAQRDLLRQMTDTTVAETASFRLPLDAYLPSRPRGRASPADVASIMAKGPRRQKEESGFQELAGQPKLNAAATSKQRGSKKRNKSDDAAKESLR